ncbi:thioredoxin family protein [Chloroflexi bacterium CFX6]|nr:thioredoxin family protein [Chloroflexi bacterium CFX6]
MKIQVLGTGCHNCLELERRLAEAVTKSGRTDVKVERVDDEHLIRHHIPLDAIPGLLIDGRLVSQREVPTIETLLDWLKAIPA